MPCGRLSWLPVSFVLHVKYTLSYRIVSYDVVNHKSTGNLHNDQSRLELQGQRPVPAGRL